MIGRKNKGSFVRVCITGGIACGKSLVGAHISEFGLPVRDADEICRELVGSNNQISKKIVELFGETILMPDGKIDRRGLGKLIFADSRKRARLNNLVHPEARRVIETWLNEIRDKYISQDHESLRPYGAVVIIPLLYEVQWQDAWDTVICVGAPIQLQIARLKERGMTENEAHQRLDAQMPVEKKMEYADYVVFNAGSKENTRRQTMKIFESIVNKMEKDYGRNK